MPEAGPSGPTCWRRLREWQRAGVWEPVWRQVVPFLDEALGTNRAEYEFLDGDWQDRVDAIKAILIGRDPESSAVSPADRADD